MQTKLTAFLALFILIGSSSVYVYFTNFRDNKKSTKSTTQQVQGSQTAKTTETSQLTPANSDNSSIPLSSNTQDSSRQLSTPSVVKDDFSQYESYKTSDQLRWLDPVVGAGAEAVKGKKVAVTYKGWLTDGTLFDQSGKDEQGKIEPFVFTPGGGQVIEGWEIGVVGMKVGGTRRLIIPPIAGYGEAGQGPIPPNAVLIFDINLLEVEK